MKSSHRMMPVVFIVIVMVSQSGLVFASPTTTLTAPTVVDKTLKPGSTFSINITISDVQRFWGYQFVLSYNTSVLTGISYEYYEPFPNAAPSEINDASGYVAVAARSYMGDPNGFSTIESVPIVKINFLVDDKGTSALDLHDSALSDVYGEWIPHDVIDGYFANIHTKVPDITPVSPTHTLSSSYYSLGTTAYSATQTRWHAGIDLAETHSLNGISATIEIYDNAIASTSYSDYVTAVIGIERFSPTAGKEYIEIGSIQDNKGLFLFVAITQHGAYHETIYASTTAGSIYSLEIRSIDNVHWIATINGNFVDHIWFASDASPEKYAVAEFESGDPTNPMRGHLFNLTYYDVNWNPHNWQQINFLQDDPYYARFNSTEDLCLLDPAIYSTIQGDVNLDYIVDILDAGYISAHWGGPPAGALGYHSTADINHDGTVNVVDVANVNAQWMRRW